MNTPCQVNAAMADTFLKVSDQLLAETERGSVVLAFAWMDEELTRILRRHFLPTRAESEKADELFGVGRPVGDAATKIDVAFRLNLINAATRESLHLARRLRNDFAHLSTSLTFETDSVKDRVKNLFRLQEEVLGAIWSVTSTVPELRAMVQAHEGKEPVSALLDQFGAKRLFAMTAGTIVAGLVMITSEIVSVANLVTRHQSEA